LRTDRIWKGRLCREVDRSKNSRCGAPPCAAPIPKCEEPSIARYEKYSRTFGRCPVSNILFPQAIFLLFLGFWAVFSPTHSFPTRFPPAPATLYCDIQQFKNFHSLKNVFPQFTLCLCQSGSRAGKGSSLSKNVLYSLVFQATTSSKCWQLVKISVPNFNHSCLLTTYYVSPPRSSHSRNCLAA